MSSRFKKYLSSYKLIFIIFLVGLGIRLILRLFDTFYWSGQSIYSNPFNILLYYTIEPYKDYEFYYQRYATQFLFTDWIPYTPLDWNEILSDLNLSEPVMSLLLLLYKQIILNGIIYPPLFLYIITLPAIINVNLVFIPLLISDLLIPVYIYKILKELNYEKIAKWGFCLVIFCPLMIFYNGVMFMNTSIVTLFFLIALYYVIRKKDNYAIVFLALSILVKQIIIFLVIPIFFYLIFRTDKRNDSNYEKNIAKNFCKYTGTLIIILIIGSIPWIILSPEAYISSMLAGEGFEIFPSFGITTINMPMQWYTFLIEYNAPYWLIYICGFLNFTLIGLILSEIFAIYFILKWAKEEKLNFYKLLDVVIFISIMSHLFFSRGVYKYYFTFHIPLLILWILLNYKQRNLDLNFRKLFLSILGISMIFIILPRYFYLFIIWILFGYFMWKNTILTEEFNVLFSGIIKSPSNLD